MKTREKNAVIVAVVLLAAGAVIAALAAALIGFDFSKLGTTVYEPVATDVSGNFDGISVECADADVRILPSENGKCTVICPESDKITHSVTVEGGTITVIRHDNRKWYEHIGFFWDGGESNDIYVYLPGSEYETLQISSVSGDISVHADLSFGKTELTSTSGDIDCKAGVTGDLNVKTVSGDINVVSQNVSGGTLNAASTSGDVAVSSAKLSGDLTVKTVSGDVKLLNVDCSAALVNTTSGNIGLTQVTASGGMKLSTVSGDVRLDKSDADTLDIKTTSGNVTGTLLTGKKFSAESTSGNIRVPDSDSSTGGTCRIKTTSGNVKIEISE